jgi:mannose-6-phosphate isomerase
MSEFLSENNPYYTYKIVDKTEDLVVKNTKKKNIIVSYYILNGSLNFSFKNEKISLLADGVIIISSTNEIVDSHLGPNSKVLEIHSLKKKEKTIQIEDRAGKRLESEILDYKIFYSHKKVEKPWGYEIWYVWLKDYHVLKKIFMKKGNKCSLQYHDQKYETNYLVSGEAKITKGLYVDINEKKGNIFKKILSLNLDKYFSITKKAPYVFTNIPGEVHRVYSQADYIAYEVSTPELDDVIRIQDDNSRPSGLIVAEHKQS